MDWKTKLLDNLISQKVLFGLVFTVLVVTVDLTATQSNTFNTLIITTIGGSAVKTLAGAYTANKKGKDNGKEN